MLVKFSSTATESITMFGEPAVELLKMMGATGRVPGGLSAEEIPSALEKLQTGIERLRAQTRAEAPPAEMDGKTDEDEDSSREPPVALETRAVPLISLLKRAAAAGATVMWERQ
ncbi:MAG TPA: DUF1840 domain-containing protein [Steroidobacteraceae bacterium]|jgi:hypothetical protein